MQASKPLQAVEREQAHTPAPWWATDYGVRNSGGFICATTWPPRYEGQEERYAQETSQREADARLIAASPRMLEALERIADNAQQMALDPEQSASSRRWWTICEEDARAAIAATKAP